MSLYSYRETILERRARVRARDVRPRAHARKTTTYVLHLLKAKSQYIVC